MRASSPEDGKHNIVGQRSFPFIRVTRSPSLLTEVFAEAGLLEAAKRRSHVGLVVGVDEHGSSLQSLAHIHGLVDVAGEHARSQTVLCVVGSLQHAFHIPVERRVGS